MSEISKYDAQKKKLDGLCEEHDLTFRLRHDRYPITLTIKPLTGMDQQMDMLADAENKDYISQDASMVIYRKDGELATKITGTFTISEALRNKFKNIYIKISDYWLQYFFRDIMEKDLIAKSKIPVIDEDEAEDNEEEEELPDPEETEDDAEESEPDEEEVEADPEVDAELGLDDSGEDAATDDLIVAATQLVRMENKASISLLQRRLKIGYARATRIMQALEDAGVVGPYDGSNPREVLPADVPAEG
ncbi:MAG TPA: hypothetical protein DEV97_03010 [Lachnospiraceae bacterium]|nr:hypothetical protein [Lachnospiraceae bacterium]